MAKHDWQQPQIHMQTYPLPAPMTVCKDISLEEALEEIFILLHGKKKR